MINNFINQYAFLSNFYPVPVTLYNKMFPSVEHAYQAAKTTDDTLQKMIRILPKNQAGKAKKLGQKLELRPGWEKVKVSLMRNLLRKKFSVEELKSRLDATKPEELVEGNYWHDNFWGDCQCQRCIDIKGKNTLGKLLMEIRDGVVFV